MRAARGPDRGLRAGRVLSLCATAAGLPTAGLTAILIGRATRARGRAAEPGL